MCVSTHDHIALREEEFLRAARSRGLQNTLAIAKALGMSHTSVGRVLNGEYAPGTAFISRSIRLFGVKFEDLFELTQPLAGVR